MKRLAKILAVLLAVLMLSGCTFLGAETDSLLVPPKPGGELYEIREALLSSVKENFTLKYPSAGENRSAIIQQDINGDGKDEAVAFYSTVKENFVSMHINYIRKADGKWHSAGSFKCVAAGVDTVEFADLNGDGIKEIIVGWSIYGNIDKMLGVYSVSDGKLVQKINQSYTNYLTADLNNDGENEVFTSHLTFSDTPTATANMFILDADNNVQISTASLDSTVSGYSAPVVGKLPNGNTAVYLDAIKGAGAITEVLEVDNNTLKNALMNEQGIVADTYRTTGAVVRDIDGDGIYEIPTVRLITAGDEMSEGVYRTDWHTVQNAELILKYSTVMNYNDGYFVILPEKWLGKITVTRDTSNRIRSFLRLDEETGNSADMLVRVQATAVTKGEKENAVVAGATLIAETAELKYYATIGKYKGEESVSAEEFKQYFKLIK